MNKLTTYDLYVDKVVRARNSGAAPVLIIEELKNEKNNIRSKAKIKIASMAMDRTPYPRREVARIAQECCAVIDKIIKEIEEKELVA